jgi:hypothetical protein
MQVPAGYSFVTYRYSRLMDCRGVTGFQRMPPLQFSAFGQAAIGAGIRQPFYLPDIFPGQLNAIRVGEMAIFIHQALALFDVQKIARNTDIFNPARIFIFQLLQTAQSTMITQGLPFSGRQVI